MNPDNPKNQSHLIQKKIPFNPNSKTIKAICIIINVYKTIPQLG
ncbi:MAG: hypothetical protein RLZZ628_3712 [Bacteroidota bacterium]|jgi:hypothetical protein